MRYGNRTSNNLAHALRATQIETRRRNDERPTVIRKFAFCREVATLTQSYTAYGCSS